MMREYRRDIQLLPSEEEEGKRYVILEVRLT
jgi:hypothetical protein